MRPRRPHLIGIDDGPFDKRQDGEVPLVGVVMEGCDLVEGVAIERFPVDGDGVTGFLGDWVQRLRFRPGLQGLLLDGITIAGLAVVDVTALAGATGLPVIAVNRRDPARHRLDRALSAAGLAERRAVVDRTPPAFAVNASLFASCAGAEPAEALHLIESSRRKAELPEPLRLAHLIAAALVTGSSRGRA